MHILPCVVSAALLATFISPVRATDYYVNGATGSNAANGLSPAAAWQTLTHAFTVLAGLGPGHTLWVAGGFVYSAGETFPLLPRLDLTIRGTGATAPVIAVPPGASGFVLGPVTMGLHQNTVIGIRFDGGANGVSLQLVAASGSVDHMVVVEQCEFTNQSHAGVQVVDVFAPTSAGPALMVRECSFTGAPFGIHAHIQTDAAYYRLTVENCQFTATTDTGIHSEVDRHNADHRAMIRGSLFTDCGTGVLLRGGFSVPASPARISACRFTRCTSAGVRAIAAPDLLGGVEIADSGFSACGTGVTFEVTGINPTFGLDHGLTVRGNLFEGCANGVRATWLHLGEDDLTLTDNWFEACGTAARITTLLGVDVVMARNRLQGNSVGVWTDGTAGFAFSQGGRCDIESCVVTGCSVGGMNLSATGAAVRCVGTTVADCAVFGALLGVVDPASTISHCVFDNMAPGIVTGSPITTTYCCANNQALPGIGNLMANPQLLRPYYKLAPTSPCVDAGDPTASLGATDYEGDPRTIGPLPDLGADETTPAGTLRRYGVPGLGARGFAPRIATTNTDLRVGFPFSVHLLEATDAVGGLLWTGSGDGPLALPRSLELFGALGSYLWIEPQAAVTFALQSGGTASVSFPIAANPALIGAIVTMQWLVLKFGTNPASFVSTDALRGTVGS